MNKKLLVILSALVLFCVPQLMGQMPVPDDGYNQFFKEVQTKSTPAGTVFEPGSQLLFLLDTGIDANVWDDPDPEVDDHFASWSVLELSGGAVAAPITPEFIAITNTNPTDAVTVHFRYFNTDCDDILDFLVVLTCNDTFFVDPFNFAIPGAAKNTSQRFFGPSSGNPLGLGVCDGSTLPCWDPSLPGITGLVYGDGRFLLQVTASGDPVDNADPVADWLFPKELTADLSDCTAVDPGTIGATAGLNDDNLHILNASAMSFNYLNGFMARAIPTPTGNASYGVPAFTRPAVDLIGDNAPSIYTFNPDGDAVQAGKRYVLSGTEIINPSHFPLDITTPLITPYYLRSETHGGDINTTGPTGVEGHDPVVSLGGALDWTLWTREAQGGVPDDKQRLLPASILDDYNGSNNAASALFPDYSYRTDPVITFYALQIFNNDEEPLAITIQPPTISPPICPDPTLDPTSCSISLAVAVRCLNAYNVGTGVNVVTGKLGDLTLADVVALRPAQISAHLTPVAPDELGPGWIRMKRVNTRMDATNIPSIAYDGIKPSIATFMLSTLQFNDFGTGRYLPAAASVSVMSVPN